MEEGLIIRGVTDALTGKILFEFTVKVKFVDDVFVTKKSIWDRLRGKPVLTSLEQETHRDFQVYPCVVVNQYRIAGVAATLPADLFDDETKMLAYVPEHLSKMVYIIAAAIQNNYKEPDPELITFLERNLDNIDVANLLNVSLQATNMQSFLTSIVLMNGVAKIVVPKTSPTDGRELIASHIAV